jgi:hypothetical protein
MNIVIPRSIEEAVALMLASGSVVGGCYTFFQP